MHRQHDRKLRLRQLFISRLDQFGPAMAMPSPDTVPVDQHDIGE
jgi:hypothetical protein